MTFDEFRDSLTTAQPPAELDDGLRVLWLDAKGDWDGAHDIAQDMPDPFGSHLHAYLHRKEGDLGNAGYWYRRAGATMPDRSLQQEWQELVDELLRSQEA